MNTPGYAPQQPARTPSDGQQPKNVPGEQLESDAAIGGIARDLSKVMVSEIHTLTDDEIEKLLDQAEAEFEADVAIRRNKGLPKNPHSLLREAIRSNSFHKITLPRWVIDKYKLSGDDAIPGKKLADSLVDTRKIWEK